MNKKTNQEYLAHGSIYMARHVESYNCKIGADFQQDRRDGRAQGSRLLPQRGRPRSGRTSFDGDIFQPS
jgi:hypothetical protein